MNHRKMMWMGGLLAGLGITAAAWAQAPAIPGVPVAPAAPAPANIWSFLLPNADQKLACKTHFCNSAIGKLVSGASGPVGAMTGGLLGGRCEKNAIQNDLMNKPADDPNGLAARVKADEEAAKARRQAVRFLGTVDCNYWPEAIDTLKTALRKDRNECVRFEAALALRNGCCCNNEIIDALKQSILGENKTDPNPIERSDRVRAAAADALARCPLASEPRKDDKLLTSNPNVDPTEYYKKIASAPREELAAGARAVLASLQKGDKLPPPSTETTGSPAPTLPTVAAIPPRPNSVSDIVSQAFAPAFTTTGPRQPFFTSLTKTLTGNQETMPPARQEVLVPLNTEIAPLREIKPVTPFETPRPYPLSNNNSSSSIDQPRPNIPVTNVITPVSAVGPTLPVSRSEQAPMTIQLLGPNRIGQGSPAVFDVRVTNHSGQPLNGIVLYGWLSESLSHSAGQEIKGEVDMTIPPGATRTLRLPTHAVKAGHGLVQVKVATNAGEAFAKMEIDIAGLLQSIETTPPTPSTRPALLQSIETTPPTRPALSFASKTVERANVEPIPPLRAVVPVEIIQSPPGGDRPTGTVGVVTMEEEVPPAPVTSPLPRR